MTLQDTIVAPPIRSIGEYNFPSRSAHEAPHTLFEA